MIPARPAGWLALASVQPFLMEGAYQVAAWWWADPAFVRLISLSGPLIMILALSLTPIIAAEIEMRRMRRHHYTSYEELRTTSASIARSREDILTNCIAIAWLLWLVPQIVGLEQNWAYRVCSFALQAELVVMWVLAIEWEPTSWLVEWAARWVGLGGAVAGTLLFIFAQFLFPDTPFLGVMAGYDPRTETTSEFNIAAGFPWAVFVLPTVSIILTLALAAIQIWRCQHRKWRRTT